jgi:DNA-binding CsgD family transcriptional regulator
MRSDDERVERLVIRLDSRRTAANEHAERAVRAEHSVAWKRLLRSLDLSGRESQIVSCFLQLHDREDAIAQHLGLSKHTIHTHLERLYRKVGVNSRSQLLALLLVNVLDPESREARSTSHGTWC